MTTRIDAAATSVPRRRWFGRDGALHLSDAAARTCLTRGHHRSSELELVINVGMYKDHGLAEPALASMIQEDLGANLGHPPQAGTHGTFSFDVLNGGVGLITAAHLCDAFVGSGVAKLAMIVAGDADPSPRTTRHYPFSAAGGAVLLAHDDHGAGFQRFLFRTYPEDAGLFVASTRWDPHAGRVPRGRNVLELYEAPAFATRCSDEGRAVVSELLAQIGLPPSGIDLLVTSAYPRTFAQDIARGLGIAADRLPRLPATLARAHTAGPIASLEVAIQSGQFARAKHIVFVTAGAGLTIGAAYYRNEHRAAQLAA